MATPYTLTLQEAETRLRELVRQIQTARQPIILTTEETAEPIAMLVTFDDYEATQTLKRLLSGRQKVSFRQHLDDLRQLLNALKQNWSSDLVRQVFPRVLRADLRTLWHLCRPSRRELCTMLELAAARVRSDDLSDEQVAAFRFALDLLEQETLTEDDLNEIHERLTAAGLPPAFAFDAEMVQSYIDDL